MAAELAAAAALALDSLQNERIMAARRLNEADLELQGVNVARIAARDASDAARRRSTAAFDRYTDAINNNTRKATALAAARTEADNAKAELDRAAAGATAAKEVENATCTALGQADDMVMDATTRRDTAHAAWKEAASRPQAPPSTLAPVPLTVIDCD